MNDPVFLLGAGFNRDARDLAGPIMGRSIYIGEYQINCGYPLVSDLWHLCFPTETPEVDDSVERQFQRSVDKGNWEPLKNLYQELMKADYYLIPALLPDVARPDNCYATFFKDFPTQCFLTFNYDSLPEVFLFRLGRWFPNDGYGVPVEADLDAYEADTFQVDNSASLVLHLHGSLCVYGSEFEILPPRNADGMSLITSRAIPKFYFDPDAIMSLFTPYRRFGFDAFEYEQIEERVIAPVPNKAIGLKNVFIRAVYSRAKSLLSRTDCIVAIGYDFNRHDTASYDPILKTLSERDHPSVVLVSPNATDIHKRLSIEYRPIKWIVCNATFRQWVESGYKGLN